ncbi:fungal-specific transcription factor domain-containing protein [Phyllosticta citrichinensis]
MPQKQARKISCKRCQIRKLKCSRTDPCKSCLAAGQYCEFRDNDTKRRPVSHEYVMALENRIAWFENFVGKLKRASSADRDAMLEEMSLHDHLQPAHDVDTSKTTRLWTPSLYMEFGGSLIYHGPTSIYQMDEIDDFPVPAPSAEATRLICVAQHFGIQESWIEQGLQDFFRWQYPNCMFIYREAFIRDHCGNRYGGRYWSPPLLYSMCALGIRNSDVENAEDMSERFFAAAESISMVSGLDKPCLTTVQAFLCMAFFEVGRGNLSKGWNLSGIAFRMSQDLGLQRDPNHWISKDPSLTSPEDVQIRRRIYWGAYLSDKLISLFLGRPVSLHEDDGMVEPMDKLPDFPEMAPWLPTGLEQFQNETEPTTVPQLLPSFQSLVELAKIIQRMLTKYFSANEKSADGQSASQSQMFLDSLNLDLHRWQESLPDPLKWNKWEPTTAYLYPHVAVLHLMLNSARLRLNLDVAVSNSSTAASSSAMCLSSIENIIALIRKYRAHHGLKKASLIFVCGIVQAATGITVLEQTAPCASTPTPSTSQLNFLIQSLEECSATWGLATQAKKRLVVAAEAMTLMN